MLHILGSFFVVTEFFATTFYFTNRPRNLSYELPDETSSLLAPNVSTRKLCSSHDASGVHDNSSFVKRDVNSCNALCADVVLSSSTTCSKGLCEHVPRIHTARSCVLVGVFFANSSDKLSVPQPGSHVTTGGCREDQYRRVIASVGTIRYKGGEEAQVHFLRPQHQRVLAGTASTFVREVLGTAVNLEPEPVSKTCTLMENRSSFWHTVLRLS